MILPTKTGLPGSSNRSTAYFRYATTFVETRPFFAMLKLVNDNAANVRTTQVYALYLGNLTDN
jgi:hypothetical protein